MARLDGPKSIAMGVAYAAPIWLSIAAAFALNGCTPKPGPAYIICNSVGCGDNVDIEIVDDTANSFVAAKPR
jgi:hypothetical protein